MRLRPADHPRIPVVWRLRVRRPPLGIRLTPPARPSSPHLRVSAVHCVRVNDHNAPRRMAEGRGAGYFRMLTARAITSAPMPSDTHASTIMRSLAHGLIAEVSVGLNAVAVQKASDR